MSPELQQPVGYAVREIVGYHAVGPEDDYLTSADLREYLSLGQLIREAGGDSVEWAVVTAHQRKAEGIELGPFESYLETPLPPKKRYRVTVAIFDP